MHEARQESVSVSYIGKNAKRDHWLIRVSRALVYYLSLDGGSSQMLKQNNDAGTRFRKWIGPTNETGHVEISDSQRIWSRDKQQTEYV